MSVFRREFTFAELGWDTAPNSPASSGRATPIDEAMEGAEPIAVGEAPIINFQPREELENQLHRANLRVEAAYEEVRKLKSKLSNVKDSLQRVRRNHQQKVQSLTNKSEASTFLLETQRMRNGELKKENKELVAHLSAVSGLMPLIRRPNSFPASEEELAMVDEEIIIGHLIRDDIVQTQISIHPNGQVTMMVTIGLEDVNKRCTWHSLDKRIYNVDGPSLWRGDRKGVPYYFADLSIVNYGERREVPDDIARLLKSSFICTVVFGGFYNLELLISLLEADGVQCITNQ